MQADPSATMQVFSCPLTDVVELSPYQEGLYPLLKVQVVLTGPRILASFFWFFVTRVTKRPTSSGFVPTYTHSSGVIINKSPFNSQNYPDLEMIR